MVACGSFEELQTTGIDFAALLKEHESLKQEDVSRTSSIYSIPGAIATEINPIADDIILEVGVYLAVIFKSCSQYSLTILVIVLI